MAQTVVFTSSGTWVPPDGVESVTVECWGAGGGGGSSGATSGASGGGGGGAYSKKVIALAVGPPTAPYTVTVGTGAAATNGGDSWFKSTADILAKGGTKGANSTGVGGTGVGGAGGAAASGVGTTKFSGGTGQTGGAVQGGGGGGGAGDANNGGNAPATPTGGTGGATGGGNGGAGANLASGAGTAGSTIGGGGGAGGSASGAGAAGARGEVRITYEEAGVARSSMVPGIANKVVNPSAETDTSGWTASPGTLSRGTDQFDQGSASFKLVTNATTAPSWISSTGTSGIAVVPKRSYSFQARVRPAQASRNGRIQVNWYTSDGTILNAQVSGSITALTQNAWNTLQFLDVLAPSGAVFCSITVVGSVSTDTGRASGDTYWMDSVMMVDGPTMPAYFAGQVFDSQESISDTGSNTSVSAQFGDEALLDNGTSTSIAVPSSLERIADVGTVITLAIQGGSDSIQDVGGVSTASQHDGADSLVDSGLNTSSVVVSGSEKILDEGTLISIAISAGAESLTDLGLLTSIGVISASEFIAQIDTVNTIAVLTQRESIIEPPGNVTSIALHTAFEALLQADTVTSVAVASALESLQEVAGVTTLALVASNWKLVSPGLSGTAWDATGSVRQPGAEVLVFRDDNSALGPVAILTADAGGEWAVDLDPSFTYWVSYYLGAGFADPDNIGWRTDKYLETADTVIATGT